MTERASALPDEPSIRPGEGAGLSESAYIPSSAMYSRIVEVYGAFGNGKMRYGSGSIVAGRNVLTAAHVVKGADAVFVRTPEKIEYAAVVDPEFVGDPEGKSAPDLALVSVPDWPNPMPAIPLAGINYTASEPTRIGEAHAIGYPLFAEHPDGMMRETIHAVGEIPVLSGMVRGLAQLNVRDTPLPVPPLEKGSLAGTPWAGMSGAPVLAQGYLLGVITIHAPRAGQSAITLTPLTALNLHSDHPGWGKGVPNPMRWWQRLGESVTEASDRPQLPLLPLAGQTASLVRPLFEWDPEDLGVHRSISMTEAISHQLSPYVTRQHDRTLGEQLREVCLAESRAKLIILTGNSCTGKTRSIYEAANEVLANWPTLVVRAPTDIISFLEKVPAPRRLLIWLDELQSAIPSTEDGQKAAGVLRKLLDNHSVRQVAVLGSIWPYQHKELIASRHTSTNGSQVADLLLDRRIVWIEVPDEFTADELKDADTSDPRISMAVKTARSGQITQVIAGGPQLVARMYPSAPEHRTLAFPPVVRAVIQSAAELRRIGYPNPLPSWAVLDCAPSFLSARELALLPENWQTDAIAEAIGETGGTSHLTMPNSTVDVRLMGVPALKVESIAKEGRDESYQLHDFLLQDHLGRNKYHPLNPTFWDCLLKNGHRIGPVVLTELADNASSRGMTTTACQLLAQAFEGYGYLPAHMKLHNVRKQRSEQGDRTATRYYWRIVPDRRRSRSSWQRYSTWGTLEEALTVGLSMFRFGPPSGQDGYWIQAAAHLAKQGDAPALSILRDYAERYPYAETHLASTLEILAGNGDESALSELREYATRGQLHAQFCLAAVLDKRARGGDEAAERELSQRAESGEDSSQIRYSQILGERAIDGDEDAVGALKSRVHALERGMCDELLDVYRAQYEELIVIGLDSQAGPDFAPRVLSQRVLRFLHSLFRRPSSGV